MARQYYEREDAACIQERRARVYHIHRPGELSRITIDRTVAHCWLAQGYGKPWVGADQYPAETFGAVVAVRLSLRTQCGLWQSGRRREASVSNGNEGSTPALGEAQARRLLTAQPADTLKGVRDRAILATLLYHGNTARRTVRAAA